jgi:Leucine-rich repeat (LRR) protein
MGNKNLFMKKIILVVFIVASVCKTGLGFGQTNSGDSLVLIDLYNGTNGPNWFQPWNLTTPVSEWAGIQLANGRVVKIEIVDNELTGNIPSSIGNLTYLTYLNLESNNLTGNIPSSIGNLVDLTDINLEANHLTGSIPTTLGNLLNLYGLNLRNNDLTGDIPSSVGNLSNLTNLDLGHNQLSGSIEMFSNLINLSSFDVSYNYQLSGSFSFFGNFTHLVDLELSNNQLSGNIPSGLINNTSLEYFDCSYNNISGNIPDGLGSLSNLLDLFLNNNGLTGTIPNSLGNITKLNLLWLNNNQLTGSIPASLFQLSYLQQLFLNNNQLTGNIPDSFGNIPNLYQVFLNNNQLTGNIPAAFGLLPNLEQLFLQNNQLSGTLSSTFDSLAIVSQGQGGAQVFIQNNNFTFSGMEELAVLWGGSELMTYSPQTSIHLNYNSGVYSVSAGGTLSNNTYSWYNNGTLIATNVGDSIFTPTIQGSYSVAVTNSVATALTLYSDTINLAGDTTIMPDHPRTEYANREYTDPTGWTEYFFDNNTPNDFTDDTLLLSLYKHGQNIGTIGDGTFAVKLVATAAAGSNTGIELTNPLITNPSGFWVMNRYWNVTPTNEPDSNIGVRFYYNNQDLADVNGSYPNHDLTNQQLIFYKEIGGNPDPTTNLAGATKIISILNSNHPSDTTWVYYPLTDSTQFAEFSVASFSGGGGGGTGNDQALPIKLLSFTATKNGNKNLLQWTTAQEINSNYFSVERSNDDVSFNSLGNVTAKGNAIAATGYSFTDNKPNNGENYYRLRMVNKDGSFTYSEIRTINDAVSFAVNVYPNPVKGELTLNFSSAVATNAQIEIINEEGKIMLSKEVNIAEGASAQSINVAVLSGGTYYLKCVSSEGESEVRFVKVD